MMDTTRILKVMDFVSPAKFYVHGCPTVKTFCLHLQGPKTKCSNDSNLFNPRQLKAPRIRYRQNQQQNIRNKSRDGIEQKELLLPDAAVVATSW